MTARDGSAYGAGVGFSFSDSDTIAKIGENVSIINNNADNKTDLVVKADSIGNYVRIGKVYINMQIQIGLITPILLYFIT